jgi:mono/diheme cytochrome c family protein
MLGKLIRWAVGLGIMGGAAFWVLTEPVTAPETATQGIVPDLARGEVVFWAGGCASCHAAPGATGDAQLVLAGGHALETPFGTFRAPNISSDPDQGIGAWTDLQFLNAMRHGVGPDGRYYYPAFPYAAYARMTVEDIVSLRAFLATLPADATPSPGHDLALPFRLRRGVGLWNLLYLNSTWTLDAPDLTEAEVRGRYLVEALGHCGECHTPRDAFGGPVTARYLAGGPNPSGEGTIPGITPATLTWTEAEIAGYLMTGFTPEFDSAGGHMANVVQNLARLPPEDRAAIAAYLKRVPPVTP